MHTAVTKQITVEGIDAQTLFGMFDKLEQRIIEVSKAASKLKQEDDLLTRLEAAQLLNVSLPTLHSYINKGIIQSHKIGRKVRIRRSDIEASLKPIKYSL